MAVHSNCWPLILYLYYIEFQGEVALKPNVLSSEGCNLSQYAKKYGILTAQLSTFFVFYSDAGR